MTHHVASIHVQVRGLRLSKLLLHLRGVLLVPQTLHPVQGVGDLWCDFARSGEGAHHVPLSDRLQRVLLRHTGGTRAFRFIFESVGVASHGSSVLGVGDGLLPWVWRWWIESWR